MINNFDHQQAAHCETGAASALFRHHGLDVSEPMAFGLASGLTYAYLPFVKINGLPLMAYRMPPRLILKMLSWRIPGLKIRFKTFRNDAEGQAFLDRKLDEGTLVGLQTSVFFLPYFPQEMRFHFNAHNLLVFGKEQDEQGQTHYQISDPVFSHTVTTDADSLNQARFAKGALAPKGRLYFFESVPERIDFERLLPKAIRFTGKANGKRNITPISGVGGMKMVAKRIEKLAGDRKRYRQLFLGHIVRMQEEIGTGGAGFRYMYAAFLQEAGDILNRSECQDWAQRFIDLGDQWREFALICARLSKERGDHSLKEAADLLRQLADDELEIYNQMAKFR
ncbi:MAG: BtrH N-terminal domain-containing protein [Hydrogenovibrio sp.]|uniref:BtrH N-terminal domain-containing protein n=1 Tax=Hydrogenovibrio sp. TaxID=2065821 RepID=UPI00286FC263|nr:BtrH N-terminal domain-containing protein [Hydrogenovibrio sp.]MDR9499839.1 BtrH N-terminal domain-containing protein [Hydrogenovibrio sp.]